MSPLPPQRVSVPLGLAVRYSFKAASDFMKHLDSQLDAEAQASLVELGVDVVDAA